MKQASSNGFSGHLVFAAFLISLFLFTTPFELAGNPSMFPDYFVAGTAMLLLAPLLLLRPIRLSAPSMLVLGVLCTIILHAAVVQPAPSQFILLIAANIALAVLVYEASFGWKAEFESAVCWLLLLNAAVISLQAVLFYTVSSKIVDFHQMIFGSPARFTEDFLNIARFTGLQVEPGTYANYMGCLLAILVCSCDYSKRVFWVTLISIVSIFITNSGSAIYFAPLLFALAAWRWRDRIRLTHVLTICAAVFVYLYFSSFVQHMETRFMEQDDGSLTHRIVGLNAYAVLGGEEKFIGVGFATDPCRGCHFQDIGALFNLVARGGAVVTVALSLLLFRMVRENGLVLSLILLLIPLNEKMFFYETPLWIFFLFAATRLGRRTPRPAPVAAPPYPPARPGTAAP